MKQRGISILPIELLYFCYKVFLTKLIVFCLHFVYNNYFKITMAGFSHKKYFKLARGMVGCAKNNFRATVPRVEKALARAYIGRKLRPRNLKKQWIMSLNAGVRDLNLNYSRFIFGLNNSNIILNRKILAQLAANEPFSFKSVIDEVRVQANIPEFKKHSIQDMIRGNLITSAVLDKK